MRRIGVATVGVGLRGVYDLGRLLADRQGELGLDVLALCEPFAERAAEARAFLEAGALGLALRLHQLLTAMRAWRLG